MKRIRNESDDIFVDPTARPEKKAAESNPRNAFESMMQTPQARQKALAAEAPPLTPSKLAITDRQSKFVAHAAAIRSKKDLDAVVASVNLHQLLSTATHNIRAWRYLNLRPGRSGESEEDFIVMEGFEDDGEQWAGSKLLKLMQVSGACDCVVVCTRWYGGELLGPVRFQHIEAVSLSALHAAGFIDEPKGTSNIKGSSAKVLTANGEALDVQISDTVDNPLKTDPPATSNLPENAADHHRRTNLEKAIRLLRAKEGTLESLKHQIQRLELRIFENQKSLRTLKGTRSDDLKGPQAPPSPGQLKGPPPASAYADLTQEQAESRAKERDNEILMLKSKLAELKEKVNVQEKRHNPSVKARQ
ncbi:hypothetical protein HDU96_003383 [Phlyctochytrium bullatum]|nr:hypothetical protein HDU96_003383 [Phlyctochytrium bullatum]